MVGIREPEAGVLRIEEERVIMQLQARACAF